MATPQKHQTPHVDDHLTTTQVRLANKIDGDHEKRILKERWLQIGGSILALVILAGICVIEHLHINETVPQGTTAVGTASAGPATAERTSPGMQVNNNAPVTHQMNNNNADHPVFYVNGGKR